MSRKRKGTTAERELVHLLWERGWACLRTAGSGSTQFPAPDIIAGNKIRIIAIECKFINSTRLYLPKEEVKQLIAFSEYFGAEPWIGVKFQGIGWFFLSIDDLELTEKSYVASVENAQRKGLTINDLTKF